MNELLNRGINKGERLKSRTVIVKVTPAGLDRVKEIAERDNVSLDECFNRIIEIGIKTLENNPDKSKNK